MLEEEQKSLARNKSLLEGIDRLEEQIHQGAFHINSTPKIRQYLLYLPLCFA